MYFGFESSSTLPPNAITFALASQIGNINLFLYLSINCPLSFLFTNPDSNISRSPNPCFFNSWYSSSNFPEKPILNAFNVSLLNFLFFTYSWAILACGLYKFSW